MSNKLVIRRLESRLKDARGLIGFHSDLTGDERGRRYEVDALNRGAVVLAVAAWDAFVEDLARDNSLTLARRLRSPASLPSEVRKSLLVWLHESVDFKQPTDKVQDAIWSLTGAGWRVQYVRCAKDKAQSFGVPNAKQVRKLFKSTVGIEDITEAWAYRRWVADVYRHKLDRLLELRNRIAHGSIDDETVGKTRASDAVTLVSGLGRRSVEAMGIHLKTLNLLKIGKAKDLPE